MGGLNERQCGYVSKYEKDVPLHKYLLYYIKVFGSRKYICDGHQKTLNEQLRNTKTLITHNYTHGYKINKSYNTLIRY